MFRNTQRAYTKHTQHTDIQHNIHTCSLVVDWMIWVDVTHQQFVNDSTMPWPAHVVNTHTRAHTRHTQHTVCTHNAAHHALALHSPHRQTPHNAHKETHTNRKHQTQPRTSRGTMRVCVCACVRVCANTEHTHPGL